MPIEGIVNQDFVDQQVAKTSAETGVTNGFDPDLYMKIFLTSLQNQSPFEPVETSEIMDQQATLTQVEQTAKQTAAMQNLEENVNSSLAGISTTLAEINATLNTLIDQQ